MIAEKSGFAALILYTILTLTAVICYYVDAHQVVQPWHPIMPLSKIVIQAPYVPGLSRFIDVCWPIVLVVSPYIYRENFAERLNRVAKGAGRSPNTMLVWNCLVGTPFVLVIVFSLALAPFAEPEGRTWGSKLALLIATEPIWFVLMAPFVAVGVALLINSLIFTWVTAVSRIFKFLVASNE